MIYDEGGLGERHCTLIVFIMSLVLGFASVAGSMCSRELGAKVAPAPSSELRCN